MMLADISMCYKDPNQPGPTHYFVEKEEYIALFIVNIVVLLLFLERKMFKVFILLIFR